MNQYMDHMTNKKIWGEINLRESRFLSNSLTVASLFERITKFLFIIIIIISYNVVTCNDDDDAKTFFIYNSEKRNFFWVIKSSSSIICCGHLYRILFQLEFMDWIKQTKMQPKQQPTNKINHKWM